MDFLRIRGGKKLKGSVKISGAKNAALPLIASSILAKNEVTISNIPNVKDIKTLLKLLSNLGAEFSFENSTVKIDTSTINHTKANYDIVRTMRASILTLGPLLARFGHCEVSLPGGCAIGQRPIDLHLKALKRMGANIEIKQGYVVATAKSGLKGSTIVFDKVTVTGSENIIMAAALAKGNTKIINVAKEPEVVQLCEVLNKNGIKIEGIGTDEIEIEGSEGELLDMDPFDIIPDRIEAGTYLCAGAITNSKIKIENVIPAHLEAILIKLQEMGFSLNIGDDFVEIEENMSIDPVKIATSEYPGFPTDMQAQFMALSTQADGVSVIEERLFENRFMHVSELQRMGAKITLKGNIATIEGKTNLMGADVMATDLRASSALVLAGLAAEGITNIHRIYHLDRGYENLESKLTSLGADVERLSE
ncbi:MAG: UDP-N-acetylglucosamine 1-carboxyvinyltransferase [Epsilonproteobacteria bacterium]|nr:UDP-N-acetylglucosamine 1-carboxyvinyltransferase [Campylobacterota bacterium]